MIEVKTDIQMIFVGTRGIASLQFQRKMLLLPPKKSEL